MPLILGYRSQDSAKSSLIKSSLLPASFVVWVVVVLVGFLFVCVLVFFRVCLFLGFFSPL